MRNAWLGFQIDIRTALDSKYHTMQYHCPFYARVPRETTDGNSFHIEASGGVASREQSIMESLVFLYMCWDVCHVVCFIKWP